MYIFYVISGVTVLNCALNLALLPRVVRKLGRLRFTCHIHFWLTVVQLHCCFVFVTLGNLVMSVTVLLDQSLYPLALQVQLGANMLATLGTNSFTGFVFIILFERFLATVMRNHYERDRHVCVIMTMSIGGWAFGLFNVLSWNVFKFSWGVIGNLAYGVDGLSVILICALWWRNAYLKNVERRSRSMSLSRRYQIHENVRVIGYCVPLMLIGSIGLFASGWYSSWISDLLGVYRHPSGALIYFSAFNLAILLVFIFDDIRFLAYNVARHIWWQCLGRRKNLSRTMPSRHLQVTRPVENEIEHHFASLRQAWKADFETHK